MSIMQKNKECHYYYLHYYVVVGSTFFFQRNIVVANAKFKCFWWCLYFSLRFCIHCPLYIVYPAGFPESLTSTYRNSGRIHRKYPPWTSWPAKYKTVSEFAFNKSPVNETKSPPPSYSAVSFRAIRGDVRLHEGACKEAKPGTADSSP